MLVALTRSQDSSFILSSHNYRHIFFSTFKNLGTTVKTLFLDHVGFRERFPNFFSRQGLSAILDTGTLLWSKVIISSVILNRR